MQRPYPSGHPVVVAVVVTWNRAELLAQCLTAVTGQSRPPERVIVVDNASTDATAAVLAQYPGCEVLRLRHNTGGAGGFAAGVRAAVEGPGDAADLVWLLDDDTMPEPDALAELVRARDRYPAAPPELMASRVVWTDGRDHPMNTPRTRPRATTADLEAAAAVGCRPVRSASFVSVLLDAAAVRRHGLPVADYFLWNDDFEYTARLLRDGVGLWCPTSVAVHATRAFGAADADPGERFYYEVRNKAWLFTRSPALAPAEKLLYAGATANRWARTFVGSSDRATLWAGLRRGLADARVPPRPTDEVLALADGTR